MNHITNEFLEQVRTPYKLNDCVLTPTYREGDFDSHQIDAPFLFSHDGRYRMLYVAFDGKGYRTGLASSDDLLNWQRDGLVHDRGPKGSVTEFNIAINCVLRDTALFGDGQAKLVNGKMLAAWHGYPHPGQEEGKGYTGLAWGDGLNQWQLTDPILTVDGGAPWERGGIYKPCLIDHDGRYYIFYNAKEKLVGPWYEQIGVIWSDDLTHWTRFDGNPIIPNGGPGSPDERFAADPCVLRHNDKWVMFYYGLAADGHARELVAFSDDLLYWQKGNEILIDVGPEGSIDSQYAHKPGVIARKGVLYHFYGAARPWVDDGYNQVKPKDRRGIGLATSQPIQL